MDPLRGMAGPVHQSAENLTHIVARMRPIKA
jgi:hypothetical protein